jgi:thiosulfate dehydrogenase
MIICKQIKGVTMRLSIKVLLSSVMAAAALQASGLGHIPDAPVHYPPGKLGEMVKLGRDILLHTNTNPLTKDMVGNKLKCVDCHLADQNGHPGASKTIGTFIGTATAMPAFSKREGTVQTLQDRINNCFMRSMGGKRPIVDSKASIAMAAYVTWLSEGLPIHMNPHRPVSPYVDKMYVDGQKKFAKIQKKATHKNYIAGKEIYTQKCAACHGVNGEGMGTFPPLWGKDKAGQWISYNTGAGMSKLNKAPVWIQANMPLGQGGSLSDQEAADVTLYIDAQPRKNFSIKKGLYPKSEMGYYNSSNMHEKDSVRKNFEVFGLNVDTIRGDHKIP